MIEFPEETTKWFRSYLLNKKFKLQINTFSKLKNFLCDVPQKFKLEPLLFL